MEIAKLTDCIEVLQYQQRDPMAQPAAEVVLFELPCTVRLRSSDASRADGTYDQAELQAWAFPCGIQVSQRIRHRGKVYEVVEVEDVSPTLSRTLARRAR